MTSSTTPTLLLTGASGLLGRAARHVFATGGWHVYGMAWTRAHGDTHLRRVDLTDDSAVHEAWTEAAPQAVLHCAANRRPDLVEAAPQAALRLNVHATEKLARIAAEHNIPMLYISTDYVFDGTAPPYHTDDIPQPVNVYGQSKLEGEKVTCAASGAHLVLRVPVLYGPVESLSESAVTVLLETLLNTNTPAAVSDYERRYPSHVNDIADVCLQLLSRRLKGEDISGVYHWCGGEAFTKYGMLRCMADVFQLPHCHVAPSPAPPPAGPNHTARPYDTRLDTLRLQRLGIGKHTPFALGICEVLKQWLP